MSAPVYPKPQRPDCEVIRIPNLSEWLGLAGTSDASVWAAYVDFKTATTSRAE